MTTHPVLDGRWRTPVDSDQPVHAVLTEAMRVSLCRVEPYWIKRRRCAAPGPALPAPGSALGGPPGASAPSQPHLATRSQTACPARILGAAAGLLRRIRSCPSRPSRLRHASRVGARSALVDPEPRRPGEPVAIRHGNLLVVTGSHVGNRQLSEGIRPPRTRSAPDAELGRASVTCRPANGPDVHDGSCAASFC